jgi:hypothetical protein
VEETVAAPAKSRSAAKDAPESPGWEGNVTGHSKPKKKAAEGKPQGDKGGVREAKKYGGRGRSEEKDAADDGKEEGGFSEPRSARKELPRAGGAGDPAGRSEGAAAGKVAPEAKPRGPVPPVAPKKEERPAAFGEEEDESLAEDESPDRDEGVAEMGQELRRGLEKSKELEELKEIPRSNFLAVRKLYSALTKYRENKESPEARTEVISEIEKLLEQYPGFKLARQKLEEIRKENK